jgi:hypothetical protein
MTDWLTLPGLTRQAFLNLDHLTWWAQPNKILLHSTEGGDFPSAGTYGNGRKAPHFTIHPRKREMRQHYPLTEAAWALAAPNSTHTNTAGVIQIEIVGSCVVGNSPSVLNFDDGDLAFIATLLKGIADPTGISLTTSVQWLSYPDSYGLSYVRLTQDEWYAYRGVLGHMHAPANVHGDPGTLNVARILELANGVTIPVDNPITPPPPPALPPTPPEEYNMDRLDLSNAASSSVTGRHVDNLQGLLLAAGYGPAGLVGKNGRPDGIAGKTTQACVADWQVKTNTGDGNGNADLIVGAGTWKSLIEY